MDSTTFWRLLVIALLINWVVQLVRIMRTNESYFRQPTDRVLWFLIVLMLTGVGAVIYLVWSIEHTKKRDAEIRHQQQRAEIDKILDQKSPLYPESDQQES